MTFWIRRWWFVRESLDERHESMRPRDETTGHTVSALYWPVAVSGGAAFTAALPRIRNSIARSRCRMY